MTGRPMLLTPELIASVHRQIDDPGPSPDATYLEDADYAAMVETTLGEHPNGSPLWLFAYGSLIWKPEIEHLEERVARLHGWRRSFCLKLTRWRGTAEQPGLMLGLDRGGACQGVALRLPEGNRREQLGKLFRREMTAKPSTYIPRWLKVSTQDGPVRALGFVINPKGRAYCGKLSEEDVVAMLATGCGHWGSCAEYLHNAVTNLEARGIHDRYLWRLQALVARSIAARQ
ncbi:MAG: gamma-glutamylcyclotransferase [Hyphomicrobiales bacterium]|nr:gamma-glutamylcyclotransferase [Hyphomicrobiales bacterium]